MTEAEAKKKLCPQMTRPVSLGVEGRVVIEWVMCQGAGCMAWRERKPKDYTDNIPAGTGFYCGLAGSPK